MVSAAEFDMFIKLCGDVRDIKQVLESMHNNEGVLLKDMEEYFTKKNENN